jgi:hypothetical protein
MTTRPRLRRQGMVLTVALVCLIIVMALIGGLLQGTLRARRQLHVERDRRQTELLLDAGARRAAWRLSSEADYRGESWSLPAEEIVGAGAGQVTIAAARQADNQPWQVQVVAEYPLGTDLSIRRSRTILVPSKE